jgi:hypothetical protein
MSNGINPVMHICAEDHRCQHDQDDGSRFYWALNVTVDEKKFGLNKWGRAISVDLRTSEYGYPGNAQMLEIISYIQRAVNAYQGD